MLPQLATKRPQMIVVLENSLSQGGNATGFFRVCWAGRRLRAGMGTSRLLDPLHRHCHQDQQPVTAEEEVCVVKVVQGRSLVAWALE